MKQSLAFLSLIVLVAGVPAWGQEPSTQAIDPAQTLTPRQVHRSLEKLARSLAGALADPEARTVLRQALDGRSHVTLADLAAHEMSDGSLFLDRLADAFYALRNERGRPISSAAALEEIFGVLAAMPATRVSVVGVDAWSAGTETLLTTYARQDVADDLLTEVRAFDAAGRVVHLDAWQTPAVPVVVVELRELGDAGTVDVRPAIAPKAVGGTCTNTTTYQSYPLIVRAAIWDIHEGLFNGPEGFGYFRNAGTEKTGNLPSSLGGLSGWSTNVWGSNFQGPIKVTSTRDQWEWTADGWLQYAYRTYPAMYCRQTVSSTGSFALLSYNIYEDDDGWNGDDYVGKVRIDHRFCKTEVFDLGLTNTWTPEHTTTGVDDVDHVRYKLYCTKTTGCNATLPCPSGGIAFCSSSSGSCAAGTCATGPDYVQCNGVRFYCETCILPPCPE